MEPAGISIKMNQRERDRQVAQLVKELPVLRTRLGVSQEEMGEMLGITRQTYSAIETGRRAMSWSLYLSLIFLFEHDERTCEAVKRMGLYPEVKFAGSDSAREGSPLSSFIRMEDDDIRNYLDDQAIHAIEAVIMVEYARCNHISGDAVVKSFDGRRLSQSSENDVRIARTIRKMKSDSDKDSIRKEKNDSGKNGI